MPRIHLNFVNGDKLYDDTVVLGRRGHQPFADLVRDETTRISRFHATIFLEPDGWYLKALTAVLPTTVNGDPVPLRGVRLHRDDVIYIGRQVIKVGEISLVDNLPPLPAPPMETTALPTVLLPVVTLLGRKIPRTYRALNESNTLHDEVADLHRVVFHIPDGAGGVQERRWHEIEGEGTQRGRSHWRASLGGMLQTDPYESPVSSLPWRIFRLYRPEDESKRAASKGKQSPEKRAAELMKRDCERLNEAWESLLRRHPDLAAVFPPGTPVNKQEKCVSYRDDSPNTQMNLLWSPDRIGGVNWVELP